MKKNLFIFVVSNRGFNRNRSGTNISAANGNDAVIQPSTQTDITCDSIKEPSRGNVDNSNRTRFRALIRIGRFTRGLPHSRSRPSRRKSYLF